MTLAAPWAARVCLTTQDMSSTTVSLPAKLVERSRDDLSNKAHSRPKDECSETYSVIVASDRSMNR